MKRLLPVLLLLFTVLASAQQMLGPHDSLVQLGIDYIQAGDREAAKDAFYAAAETYAEDERPYYWLGVCYAFDCEEEGEHCDLGISFLNQAIELNRYFRAPFYHRALCKFQLKDLSGALADMDTQIEMNNDEPSYYLLRSKIYFNLQKLESACADFDQVRNKLKAQPEYDFFIQKLLEICPEKDN